MGWSKAVQHRVEIDRPWWRLHPFLPVRWRVYERWAYTTRGDVDTFIWPSWTESARAASGWAQDEDAARWAAKEWMNARVYELQAPPPLEPDTSWVCAPIVIKRQSLGVHAEGND